MKAEILPGQVIDQNLEARIKVRLTNVSSQVLRIVHIPGRDFSFELPPYYGVTIRTIRGIEVRISPGFYCSAGSRMDHPQVHEANDPELHLPEEFIATLQPGQSIDTTVRVLVLVPEDGPHKVIFSYSMPSYVPVPKGIWSGSVRSEETVLEFKAKRNIDPLRTIDYLSTQRLCQMLDELSEGYVASEQAIASRLTSLSDVTTVPALERAVARGFLGETNVVLGKLGNEKSFEVLLQALEKDSKTVELAGLSTLVERSNKPREWWMGAGERVGMEPAEVRKLWRAWWNENKATFRVIKPAPKPRVETVDAWH